MHIRVALAIGLCCVSAVAWAARADDQVTLHGQTFTVEVANTPSQQVRGLMERTSMAQDHGMLFVFSRSQPLAFWMKNTLIPLDILFFSDAHQLVAMQQDAQPCKADPCQVYPSGVAARYVLEVNAGTAAKLGLHKGDKITFSSGAVLTQ